MGVTKRGKVKVRGGEQLADVGDNLNQIFSGDTSQPAPNPTMHPTDGQKREKTVLFSNFSHRPFLSTAEGLNLIRSGECPGGHCTKPFSLKGFLLPCLGLSFSFLCSDLLTKSIFTIFFIPSSSSASQSFVLLESMGSTTLSDAVLHTKERGKAK